MTVVRFPTFACVAFGGSAAPGQPHGDTWELDGESWKRVATVSPPARQAHAMVYDERRGRTVVFGGMGPGEPGRPPPALGDTWEFDGKSWTERRVTGPGARWPDGDLNDTWEWDGAAWRHVGR